MTEEQWERKPFFMAHNVIAVLDMYEIHENDLMEFWKSEMEEYGNQEQFDIKQVEFKKSAQELINNMHGRWCVQFLEELMIVCAETIMEHWKEFLPDERVPEYKKSLIKDIKQIVKDF